MEQLLRCTQGVDEDVTTYKYACDKRNMPEGISACALFRSALANLAPLCHRQGAHCEY